MQSLGATACIRSGWWREHGAYMPVPVLLRTIAADCSRLQAVQGHDVCRVHLPQLSRLGL
jgi:hypothetical protein